MGMNLLASCQPSKNRKLKPFRVYSILFPILLLILGLETVFVFMKAPAILGNSSVLGALKKVPDALIDGRK